MILSETVRLKPHGNQIKHFKNLGYKFSPKDEIDVKVEDLQPRSHMPVYIACDLCGREKYDTYDQYNKMVSKGGYYVCIHCRQNKVIETNIKRYGGRTPFASEEVWNKALETMKEKYGVKYCSQSEVLKEKIRESVFRKYGCNSPMQNQIVKEKVVQSLYKNSSQKTSKQQRYLHQLYGGELNYPFKYYSIDICFPNELIAIEYNGGGHLLNVISGRETQDEHTRKENTRYFTLKHNGFRQMTITSSKDKLPSDEILLSMLNEAKSYFQQESYHWVEYDIDKGMFRSSLNRDGIKYDFGELRKIKEENIC